MNKILAAMLVIAAVVFAAPTRADAAVDYWRNTVTGGSGEVANVDATFNSHVIFDAPVSLPNNVVVINQPTGTLTVHAQRTDGSTGPLTCELVANGVVLDTDADSGPAANVTCTATR